MRVPRLSLSLVLLLLAVAGVQGQSIAFDYLYQFEAEAGTTSPELGGLEVVFPEAARKNGVEGRAVVSATLGEDGRARDIQIVQNLPHGVGEAVAEGLRKWIFRPASLDNKPVAVKVTLEYVVTMVYGEGDRAISKPVVTSKPAPAYPPKYAAEKLGGEVYVRMLLRADGTKKVLGVSSDMPREFDRAASAAAANLQFQPAVHKKSKKPVSSEMTVEYVFKP
jgi:TonB family protein